MSVFNFSDIPKTDHFSVKKIGGKAYNLIKLMSGDFPVPEGFLIPTEIFSNFLNLNKEEPLSEKIKKKLLELKMEGKWQVDLSLVKKISEEISDFILEQEFPKELESEILENIKEECSYAVRSSGTDEDSSDFSFAGQYDTFLNIKKGKIIENIKKCWTSLFSDRCILYRIQNNLIENELPLICVVIQRMIFSEKSGVMFTANPVNNNHNTIFINACFGLGEAFVSGKTNADTYLVNKKSMKIMEKKIEEKNLSIIQLNDGGTIEKEVDEKLRKTQVLTDSQIIELSKISTQILNHYNGYQQDIEWGFENEKFYILQSREITSLFPYPSKISHSLEEEIKNVDDPLKPIGDKNYHIMLSLNAFQMYEEPFRPLGYSVMSMLIPALQSSFHVAGGRLYMDATPFLSTSSVGNLDATYPKNTSVIVKKFLETPECKKHTGSAPVGAILQTAFGFMGMGVSTGFTYLTSGIDGLIDHYLRDFPPMIEKVVNKKLDENSSTLQKIMFVKEQSGALWKAGLQSAGTFFPISKLETVPHQKNLSYLTGILNSSTEMGLRVGDLSDILKKYKSVKEIVEKHLSEKTKEIDVILASFDDETDEGKVLFKKEFLKFMEDYGYRCQGEIDITNERWFEDPSFILSTINIGTSEEIGNHKKKFKESEEIGKIEIERILKEVQEDAKKSAWNKLNSNYTKNHVAKIEAEINSFRRLMTIREDPKKYSQKGFYELKKIIHSISADIIKMGHFLEQSDINFLTLDEIIQLVEQEFKKEDIQKLIARRRKDFQNYKKMKAPVVITHDGEIGFVDADKNLKENEFQGVAVSNGTVEGIARVLKNPLDKIEKGEILVTAYTDPGWTPIFLHISGLVTEVGGPLTHGAVVAREMNIPAVVGLKDATEFINSGDKIQIDGSTGIVTIIKKKSEFETSEKEEIFLTKEEIFVDQ
eukprot:gene1524-12650_t